MKKVFFIIILLVIVFAAGIFIRRYFAPSAPVTPQPTVTGTKEEHLEGLWRVTKRSLFDFESTRQFHDIPLLIPKFEEFYANGTMCAEFVLTPDLPCDRRDHISVKEDMIIVVQSDASSTPVRYQFSFDKSFLLLMTQVPADAGWVTREKQILLRATRPIKELSR